MSFHNDINLLIDTVKEYKKKSKRDVEWNYFLFYNINDSEKDILELIKLLGKDELIKINKFNSITNSQINKSSRTTKFIEELKQNNMNFEYYKTNGDDINGACGQMVS